MLLELIIQGKGQTHAHTDNIASPWAPVRAKNYKIIKRIHYKVHASSYLLLPSVRLSVVLGLLLASVAGAGARREDQVMPRRGRQAGVMTEDMVNIKMLNISVPGVPGQDFPILATVPDTSFRSSATFSI